MIDSIEMELMEIRHVYVEKSEALEAFDQGEYVFDSPERGMMVPVRRSDISDADEGTFFRMQREEWKNYKNVQAEMDLVPAVTSIKEARLLLMQENSFAGNRNSEELVAYILTNRYLLRLTSIDMGHVEVDQVVPDDCSALRLRDKYLITRR